MIPPSPLLAAQKASTSLTITTPIMHIMPIMQIKHISVGVLRVAQGLSRHSPPPPPCTPHCPELVGAWLSWLLPLLHCLLEVPWFWWCCPCEGPLEGCYPLVARPRNGLPPPAASVAESAALSCSDATSSSAPASAGGGAKSINQRQSISSSCIAHDEKAHLES